MTEAFSEKVPEGQVVLAKPGPGAALKKGTPVAMTVSKGRKPVEVPDFTGKSAETASREPERPRTQGRRDEAGEQRHGAQGAGHQPEPARRHAVPGGHGDAGRVQGPGHGRRPERRRAAGAAGSPVRWRPRASRSPCRRRCGFFGTVRMQDPRRQHGRPRAAPSRRRSSDPLVTAPPGAAGTSGTSGSPRCSSSR